MLWMIISYLSKAVCQQLKTDWRYLSVKSSSKWICQCIHTFSTPLIGRNFRCSLFLLSFKIREWLVCSLETILRSQKRTSNIYNNRNSYTYLIIDKRQMSSIRHNKLMIYLIFGFWTTESPIARQKSNSCMCQLGHAHPILREDIVYPRC